MRAFNLIPADERGGAGGGTGKSNGGAFVVLGLLGVLAVFALMYGLASRQISSQTSKIATLNAQAQTAQAQAARLAPYVSFKALNEQRVQAVDQLVDSRFDWAHAFHELGRVLPPRQVSLTSLSGTIGSSSGGSSSSTAKLSAAASKAATGASSSPTAAAGASGTSVSSSTPPGSVPTFTLAGCATSQAMVALTLTRLRLIDGVKEVTLQSSVMATKTGSGGGSGGSSGCKGATFAMQVAFDPLPSASAKSSPSTASTVSASALTPATGSPTTSTGGAR
jgi:hypothetical protein